MLEDGGRAHVSGQEKVEDSQMSCQSRGVAGFSEEGLKPGRLCAMVYEGPSSGAISLKSWKVSLGLSEEMNGRVAESGRDEGAVRGPRDAFTMA